MLALLELTLGSIRFLPCIDDWFVTLDVHPTQASIRTQRLLLRGASQAEKTQPSLSFLRYHFILLVHGQCLGSNLPCLCLYDSTNHQAIVIDAIVEGQVLVNKMVFQAGPWPVQLHQIVCN
jgi:hypothetical protein